jgi:hypothetical protein
MPISPVRTLWLVRERRIKPVRVITENDSKVTVRIVSANRDAKTNKMVYETFDSIDLSDAKPEEVFAVCKEALLRRAAGK